MSDDTAPSPPPLPETIDWDPTTCWSAGWKAGFLAAVAIAFRAGYHCQWIRAERRYIFDPAMKPGDPDGAFAAWKRQWGIGTLPAAVDPVDG